MQVIHSVTFFLEKVYIPNTIYTKNVYMALFFWTCSFKERKKLSQNAC